MFEIHHVAILTYQPKNLADFYCRVLGLQPLKIHYDKEKRIRSVWLRLSPHSILMLERLDSLDTHGLNSASSDTSSHQPGIHLIALSITKEQAKDLRLKIEQNGVCIVNESMHTIYFRDLDGNRIGLSVYPEVLD